MNITMANSSLQSNLYMFSCGNGSLKSKHSKWVPALSVRASSSLSSVSTKSPTFSGDSISCWSVLASSSLSSVPTKSPNFSVDSISSWSVQASSSPSSVPTKSSNFAGDSICRAPLLQAMAAPTDDAETETETETETVPKLIFESLKNPLLFGLGSSLMLTCCNWIAPKVLGNYYIQLIHSIITINVAWFLFLLIKSARANQRQIQGEYLKSKRTGNATTKKSWSASKINFISNLSYCVLGLLGIAFASHIWDSPAHSMLIKFGIAGVGGAFLCKDIVRNMLIALFINLKGTFQVGDTIKAGKIDGEVIEMGLLSITLLNEEQCPTYISYSALSSNEIVNKSQVPCSIVKIEFEMELDELDGERVMEIREDILRMLCEHTIYGKKPLCLISLKRNKCVKVILSCYVNKMDENRFQATKQTITCQVIEIIRKHAAIVC